jgi:lipoprotein-anchoring transpeptidase ErfK/SrfK
MPERRLPPVRLSAATVTKNRPPKAKAPKRARTRKPRSGGDDSRLLYWIAGGLVLVLIALMVADWEAPVIRGWFTQEKPEPLPDKPTIAPVLSPVLHLPTADEIRMKKLKEKAAEETRKLEERTALVPDPPTNSIANVPSPPSESVSPPPPPVVPPPVTDAAPPLVQPVPINAVPNAPARALPLDPNKLTTVRIAAYQVALERIHFSCGFIDGDQGMRTQRMLRAYQTSHGLPVTGVLDQATRDAIGEPGEPFLNYVVTDKDIASIMPKPTTWIAKSKVARLGYNDIWELLAEKFHCTRAYLKALNSGVTVPVAGTEVIGPKVYPAAPIPQAASLRILLSETSIEALDDSGKIVAFFPCSIAKDKAKRPHGLLTVKVVDPNPDYTFDPALFVDAAKEEGITHKIVLPPGPRNPVGTTWVGLSLPGYGIHGTPEPENISRTQSHGCFRLANWNAEKVLKMVKVGTPVDVEE